MSDLMEKLKVELDELTEHTEPSHIVDCPDDKESAAAWVTEARVMGLEVTAICGAKFVPERDTKQRPICHPCIVEANSRIFSFGGDQP